MQHENDWVRKTVLENLYKYELAKPDGYGVSYNDFCKLIPIDSNLVDFNIRYLSDKNLVKLMGISSGHYTHVKITANGIDVIERKEEFRKEFPFITYNLIHINGDLTGQVFQDIQSQNITAKQELFDLFEKAKSAINVDSSLGVEIKETAKKHIEVLERESKKQEVDVGTIHSSWQWLKKNTSVVVPILYDAIKTIITKSVN